MKRKLNWRAFFFALPIFGGTIWFNYMLVFIWKPDWATESTFWGAAQPTFYITTPVLLYGIVGSLFTKVKK